MGVIMQRNVNTCVIICYSVGFYINRKISQNAKSDEILLVTTFMLLAHDIALCVLE